MAAAPARPAISSGITLNAAAAGGSNFAGGAQLASAVAGTAAFAGLQLDQPANGYVLTAASAGLNATSNAFNVLASISSPSLLDTSSVIISPGDGATDIAADATIAITFRREVNPVTIGPATVLLTADGDPIAAAFYLANDQRSLVLAPAALPHDAKVTVTVLPTVEDLHGGLLTGSASFTTAAAGDAARPRVVAQRPANGATGVKPGAVLSLLLDRPAAAATLDGALHVTSAGAAIAGAASLSPDGRTITFIADEALPPGAVIDVALDNTLADLDATPFQRHAAHFTTAPATPASALRLVRAVPAPQQSGVALNATLAWEFTAAIDRASVGANTIVVTDGEGNAVPGAFSYERGDRVVRFTPDQHFTAATTYGVTITGAVRADTGANAEPFGFLFATADDVDEKAASTHMTANAAGAPLGPDAAFRVAFDDAIDPLTVDADTLRLANGEPMDVSIAFDLTGSEVVVTPQALLTPGDVVVVTVDGVSDAAGNHAAAATETFVIERK